MNYAPIARITLRYGVAGVAGAAALAGYEIPPDVGERLAKDGDVVVVVALAIGAVVEGVYALAKKKGWST